MATTYTVTSDRLHRVREDGSLRTYYRGDSISDLPAEDVERYKSLGAIATRSNPDAEDARGNPAGPNPAEMSEPDAQSAPVATGIAQPQASEIAPAVNGGAAPADNEPASDPAAITTPDPTGTAQPQASELVAQANSTPPAKRPALAATVGVWRAYAVQSGQLTEEEAAGKTRDQLRDSLK